MSSYQAGLSCYPTAVAAAQASASEQIGKIVTLGTSGYVVDVKSVTATSITYSFTGINSSSWSFVQTVPYTAQPCGLIDSADSLILAWLVAVVWLIAASVKTLNRGIHE